MTTTNRLVTLNGKAPKSYTKAELVAMLEAAPEASQDEALKQQVAELEQEQALKQQVEQALKQRVSELEQEQALKQQVEQALKQRVSELEEPTTEPKLNLAARFKMGMTVALGCGVPLGSIFLSYLGGHLLQAEGGVTTALAIFAFGLMASVLAVSLPHLAWSVHDLTGSGQRPSWCLAIAMDLSLVLVELVQVYGPKLGLALVCWVIMVAVAITSMCLNCWAFFRQHA